MKPLEKPIFIPVVLGTSRKGRLTEHVARFVIGQVGKLAGVETDFVDIRQIPLPASDAGEQIKDPGFSATVT